MTPDITTRTIQFMAIVGILVTTAIAIYAAQPWGDNYAYKSLPDYLLLAVFIGWAISPYVFLVYTARRPQSAPIQNILRVAAAFLIVVWGIGVLINTILIHTDAQSALIFLFLPFFQWVILGLLAVVLYLARTGEKR